MKTSIKRENDEFWVIPRNHMKTAIKPKSDVCLVITLIHVQGLTVIVNIPRTPNLWTIGHENGLKTRKRRIFGHIYQPCTGSYGPCKSPWNHKTVGNNSRKWP